MHKQAREAFNRSFTDSKYEAFVNSFETDFPGQLDFRVAETPIFVPKELLEKINIASEQIIETLRSPEFVSNTARAVPADQNVPNENKHTSFLAIDFAICKNERGELTPQLIELQGFPSVFGYQAYLSESFKKHFEIPESFRYSFGADSYEEYVGKLKELILAGEDPEHVILLEIFPEKQKTRVDFAVTEAMLGIKAVCYTKLIKEGRDLYYEKDGRKIQVKRIYNRLIFDDLLNYPDLETSYHFTDDVNVSWAGHPNWFFRISKFSIPFLKSEYVPETKFVSDYEGKFPADLENYVLKPLFSFAGSGVQLHIAEVDLMGLSDSENYILQRKVVYEPVIQAPDGLVKCEVRMMYGWKDDADKPELFVSLSRLSRGEMIGVRFNKDFTWVGGSAAFFEK
ncbi:hypothetical protein MUK70_08790 [Dyadobacter chenwenxiniae]|uniref:Circularly permuted type 2 ATP-grasp protein n=1 Tax=Dyadobacter chenwenxiniae TaxID=2906456 RepID=A0A9X1PKH3_9BACT|nr:hypothetical protein [Dyadobacter chenwenxiniae]MCF0062745.1 hypothetical protein [Dyadobacter chenwenxiniae]UON85078.1 hypothetical protein MUK70_08790 [Dyadobacter chenwenxiniae]